MYVGNNERPELGHFEQRDDTEINAEPGEETLHMACGPRVDR